MVTASKQIGTSRPVQSEDSDMGEEDENSNRSN
jgi:hypothetical protein